MHFFTRARTLTLTLTLTPPAWGAGARGQPAPDGPARTGTTSFLLFCRAPGQGSSSAGRLGVPVARTSWPAAQLGPVTKRRARPRPWGLDSLQLDAQADDKLPQLSPSNSCRSTLSKDCARPRPIVKWIFALAPAKLAGAWAELGEPLVRIDARRFGAMQIAGRLAAWCQRASARARVSGRARWGRRPRRATSARLAPARIMGRALRLKILTQLLGARRQSIYSMELARFERSIN